MEAMNFYEVNEPYRALIKAKSKPRGMQLYTETVANDDGTLDANMKEVSSIYAAVWYSRMCLKKEDQLRPMDQVIKDLTNDVSYVLERFKGEGLKVLDHADDDLSSPHRVEIEIYEKSEMDGETDAE
ncbi:hypothetical protein H9S87_18970 (plasmid) [Bacillus pumilus]|uniref:hypothetical protein n=1 Tax=Bacillus pumilus TaxID=1408 RepID=UPI001657E91A|nr:hypothetical protein [Bacillus pumilus]QNP18257.1 hypothetical protein H9S87_18970 [Bacillus pumilus]